MINRISNIVQSAELGKVKLQAVRIPKTLPQVGSFVKIEVLENLKGNYKILVNGNLFQSRLPVAAKAGDVLFAQVISGNPFTLSLDSFTAAKPGEAGIAAAVLAKFGLGKTAVAEKFVSHLLKSKKPLVKEKLKEALEFIEGSDLNSDKLQLAFIAAYFWDDNGETYSQKRSVYRRVFDLSFDELCEAIFKKTVRLSAENLETEFYETLKSKLIFEHEKFELEKNANALFGKVKSAIELADYFETYSRKPFVTESVRRELESFKEILIKYVLQKSLLNKYGLYADFAITLAAEGLHLWRFEFSRITNAKGEAVYKLESAVVTRSDETWRSKIFVTEKKVQGEIGSDGKRNLNGLINGLNEALARKFAAEINIRQRGTQIYSM